MKKKMLFIILTVLFCALSAISVLAGDVPESIITDEDTDVIIGTITKIDESKTTIEISQAMFGSIGISEIELDNFDYFSDIPENKTPKAGDYCAVAVTYDSTEGFLLYYNLCARADSLDTKTLKLAEGYDFVGRMNEYINNGDYSPVNRMEKLGEMNKPDENSGDTPSDAENDAERHEIVMDAYVAPGDEDAASSALDSRVVLLLVEFAAVAVIIAGIYIYSKIKKKAKRK